jgi:Domain of unknown function (DUF4340)
MSRDKWIIIGVIALGALGFAVYKQSIKDRDLGTSQAAAASSADFPTVTAPDDIDKISIKNGVKDEIVLEKKDDKWRLTKPVDALASQSNAKEMVSNLGTLKVKEEVVMTLDDEVKKSKKLDADQAIHVIAYKAGDKKLDITFGSSGSAGQLAMVDSKPGKVWAISGFSSWMYSKDAKAFRDNQYMSFDDQSVVSVQIENKNGPFSFTKGDKWAGTDKGAPIDHFNEQKVKDLLKDMKAANAEDYADGKPTSETGLDSPEATLTVTLKDNAGTYKLKLGNAAANGTSHYAQTSGMGDKDATIYVVYKSAADWLEADKTKFQLTADAGAPAASGSAKTAASGAPKPASSHH